MFGYRNVLKTVALLLWAGAAAHNAAAMSVSLTPSIPSPSPVGTLVTWNVTASSAADGTLWYRFRVRPTGQDFRVVRDYGPSNSLDWTASEHEGTYDVEVSVRNMATGESAVAVASYEMTSRVTDGKPVISATANALVFLYSAPPCPVGSQMRVKFQSAEGVVQTPAKACQDNLSMNFYLAGMRPNSTYWVQHSVAAGSEVSKGPLLKLTTPTVTLPNISGDPLPIPDYSLSDLPNGQGPNGVLLQATLIKGTVATDLYGNLLWYYPGQISYMTRPEAGGTFYGVWEAFGSDPSYSYVREFDLAGTTIRETNAARVSEQLAAMGIHQIDAFHHEARTLPGGKVLVLASAEQMMTDIQGPGTVDVIGDVILVLDRDMQVVWAWDSFAHLDWTRTAILGEVCNPGACPPYHLATQANDWLHGNSLARTPDGNILYSIRHQDMVVKIDYQDGLGTGNIIWRLGNGGDFQLNSNDPNPWFSHQHDVEFEDASGRTLSLFDNGDTRYAADPNAHSRGQVLQLDEQHLVANFFLNADLGAYSFALGSAQRLPTGDYHFNLGFVGNGTAQSVEVDRSGKIVYSIAIGSPDYRSFRMKDLYTP